MIVIVTYQLKDASVRDANATPPTIGRRDNTTQGVGNCKITHLSEKKQEARKILSYCESCVVTIGFRVEQKTYLTKENC